MASPTTSIECSSSDGFTQWLADAGGSIAISTYQAGKVVLVGFNGRQITVLPRDFPKPMGLAVSGQQIAVACRHQVVQLANAPVLAPHYPDAQANRYDALYLPRSVNVTGDLNIHDMAFGRDGLWMINTRFSCLSLLTDRYSFEPRWQPPFISRLDPNDRCHLNGLGMRDGKPALVTAHGMTDEAAGWRPGKARGGVLIDVESSQIVLHNLCMPHSPRFHDGQWWVLNSGRGQLCQVDTQRGQLQVVAALPGYVRGLSFVGRHALIGLSKIRSSHTFDGLPVQEQFSGLSCGVAVVDLHRGTIAGTFAFTAGCEELYDVWFLPGVIRPSILNASQQATHEAVTLPEAAYWLRSEENARKAL